MKYFLALVLFFSFSAALASSVANTQQHSQKDAYNVLSITIFPEPDPDEKLEDAPGDWQVDFSYINYSSKNNSDDKMQGYNVDFEYRTEDKFIYGGGVMLSSSTLDKLLTVGGALVFGRIWNLKTEADSFFSPSIEAKVELSSQKIYKKLDDRVENYDVDQNGLAIKTLWNVAEKWHLTAGYTGFSYNKDYSVFRRTNSEAITRQRSYIVNSLSNLPASLIKIGIAYDFKPNYTASYSVSRSKDRISQNSSTDSLLNLTSKISDAWVIYTGIGRRQSGEGVYPYASLGFEFFF